MGRMGRSSPRCADPCVPVKLFMVRLGCNGSVPAARSMAAVRFAAEIGGASDCSRRPSSLYFPTPKGVFGASSASASPLLRLARALSLVALALVDVRLRGGTAGGAPPPPAPVRPPSSPPPTVAGPPGLEPRDEPLERFFSLASFDLFGVWMIDARFGESGPSKDPDAVGSRHSRGVISPSPSPSVPAPAPAPAPSPPATRPGEAGMLESFGCRICASNSMSCEVSIESPSSSDGVGLRRGRGGAAGV
mmetsp:Transcript_74074/g.211481  ORF Transcript_74074/g.211481 Transcript_74074/m.211481 type:complete len:248 (-) Transcript_74074:154-897(-)